MTGLGLGLGNRTAPMDRVVGRQAGEGGPGARAARRRVLNRRLCSSCGMNYNLLGNTPAVPGRCDLCGGELVTREDDTEEALAIRLRDYHEKTNPVLDVFRRKEYVYTVDARPAPEIV